MILRKCTLKSVVAFVVLQKRHAGSTELLHQHTCEAGPDIFQVQRGLLCKLQNHVLGLRSESGHIEVIRGWLVTSINSAKSQCFVLLMLLLKLAAKQAKWRHKNMHTYFTSSHLTSLSIHNAAKSSEGHNSPDFDTDDVPTFVLLQSIAL